MNHEIVEEVRQVREQLIERYGGIDGYFKHSQAQERARRSKAQRRKKPTGTSRKPFKPS
jgi:hypothetical protein